VVALTVVTLFVPCVANFLVIIKEQGIRRALAIIGFITPFSFFVGGMINWALAVFGIKL
jgi:ferrous iron transport protein B